MMIFEHIVLSLYGDGWRASGSLIGPDEEFQTILNVYGEQGFHLATLTHNRAVLVRIKPFAEAEPEPVPEIQPESSWIGEGPDSREPAPI